MDTMGRTYRRNPQDEDLAEPFVVTPTGKPPPKKGRRKKRWQEEVYEVEEEEYPLDGT